MYIFQTLWSSDDVFHYTILDGVRGHDIMMATLNVETIRLKM